MSPVRNVLAVAAVELRRFTRDRSNIFFVLIFPLLLVVMIGAQFGEGANTGRVSVSGSHGALHADLVEALESTDLVVQADLAWSDALEQLARGRTDVALQVDDAANDAHAAGADVSIEVVRGSAAGAQVVEQQVRTVTDGLRTKQAQRAALRDHGLGTEEADAQLAQATADVTAPALEVSSVAELAEEFDGLGQFDLGASGQLLLFVFLTTLAGSATMIQGRRLGVVARTLSAPVTPRQLIAGEISGRTGIALFQGGYIMLATAVLFGVNWGTLWLSLLVLLFFSLVAAGAAMLLGTLMENEGAAGGLGVGLGLILAALGGSMLPLELFPDTMRTVANLTPHAWAYEAFAEIQRRDGSLVDIAPQLGVLAAMAAVLLALGAWSLRRSLSRAI